MKTTMLPIRNLMTYLGDSTATGLFIVLLVCFVLSPVAQAVTPAPDGGYPGLNTAEGQNALFNLTSGVWNTAIGGQALFNDTSGSSNTATGVKALVNNTTGSQNMANGALALFNNTQGTGNTATGYQALYTTTTGSQLTAYGFRALASNTTGLQNTALGARALATNDRGGANTAAGFQALAANVGGSYNTALGRLALANNTDGGNNTAIAGNALLNNTIGHENIAIGVAALSNNTTGIGNTATGNNALSNNSTGIYNIALGYSAGGLITGDNNIDIGNQGVAGESHTIRIGTNGFFQTRAFIAGIRGVTTANANALPVVIDSAGQLGTMSSSQRFKNDVKSMDESSEAILALKPVTFHYKSDGTKTPQFGLIAEEVAEVSPNLVVRDDKGEIYTVRYDAVNAMLLNEFLKEHRKVEEQSRKMQEQEATTAYLKSTVAEQQKDFQATVVQLRKEIEALTAGLQKVSARVEAATAPQIVTNNQ
jgi:hypothetical protein